MLLRIYSTLIAATLVTMTLVGSASAQYNMGQAFAPASYDEFGGGKRPNEGWFADYSALYWRMPSAENSLIGSPYQQSIWEWDRNKYGDPDITVPIDPTVVYPENILKPTGSMTSIVSTDRFEDSWSIGHRVIGGMIQGHHGFDIGYMRLNPGGQSFTVKNMPFVLDQKGPVAGYPILAPLGWITLYESGASGWESDYPTAVTQFTSATMSQTNDIWSVNADYIYRLHPGTLGIITELNLGARYTQFSEWFQVQGHGGWLDGTRISADAKNNLAGPSVGLRFRRDVGQWGFMAQAGYTAGFNSRSVRLGGELRNLLNDSRISSYDPSTGEITYDDEEDDDDEWARDYIEREENLLPEDIDKYNALNAPRPSAFPGQAINAYASESNQFCSMVDWRVDLSYQVTRLISLNAGYSGMWLSDVIRPAGQIDYVVGTDGYFNVKKFQTENLFLNGLEFGVTLNR